MNESYIFQWVLFHIGFSYPLFLQTWCSVVDAASVKNQQRIILNELAHQILEFSALNIANLKMVKIIQVQ